MDQTAQERIVLIVCGLIAAAVAIALALPKIGRASCRERV